MVLLDTTVQMTALIFCIFCNFHLCSRGVTGFLSLDCGGLHPYMNKNGISWIPDTKYCMGATTSQAHKCGITKLLTTQNYIAPQYGRLPVFLSLERKNCYVIPVKRGTQHLLRASFLYANYDGAAAAAVTSNVNIICGPVFRISLDSSPWAMVHIMNATQV